MARAVLGGEAVAAGRRGLVFRLHRQEGGSTQRRPEARGKHVCKGNSTQLFSFDNCIWFRCQNLTLVVDPWQFLTVSVDEATGYLGNFARYIWGKIKCFENTFKRSYVPKTGLLPKMFGSKSRPTSCQGSLCTQTPGRSPSRAPGCAPEGRPSSCVRGGPGTQVGGAILWFIRSPWFPAHSCANPWSSLSMECPVNEVTGTPGVGLVARTSLVVRLDTQSHAWTSGRGQGCRLHPWPMAKDLASPDAVKPQ